MKYSKIDYNQFNDGHFESETGDLYCFRNVLSRRLNLKYGLKRLYHTEKKDGDYILDEIAILNAEIK